jgi:hypothetical protein
VLLQKLVASPILVSYITGHWFIFCLMQAYVVLLGSLTITSLHKRMAASPRLHDIAVTSIRLAKPVLALMTSCMSKPAMESLLVFGSAAQIIRWRLWLVVGWFASMVQVRVGPGW